MCVFWLRIRRLGGFQCSVQLHMGAAVCKQDSYTVAAFLIHFTGGVPTLPRGSLHSHWLFEAMTHFIHT